MRFGTADALLDRLANAERPVVFLVGSALVAPETAGGAGVPGVEGMIERVRAVLRSRPESLAQLEATLASAKNRYQAAFDFLLERRGADKQNGIIREAVLAARLPDPAHSDAKMSPEALENDLDGPGR